ncbi:amino-terminal region of chorein [Perilla frutescens var. hirtella]|uniref:Amino-terminal region of chorein n=1 Tax=Perilla frutescens var. hirtella TaxID=608512 RepID=A0AAD4JM54_PERFH|nr:amino-terminal region of chorein [Perilla frutescens var. hirtella]KAH6835530.1 amino-terminal region of chorein [Perilla frutescens var. hirtella]
MESILARALEYTLKYWLKSFSRDQFKLQGRTVQLSNLDINGDALHASMGLPPALNVTTAKVGKLEIILPSVSYVQVEPIVVQIDRLDLVLEENDDIDVSSNPSSASTSTSAGKGNGYGFADKIADGMTIQILSVNLLLETHGGARRRGGATWASPMASITIRNLLLCTTNENWEVVNLKEARDFSTDKKFIYVFKKLEWEHLSIDLLPHPDMFLDANFLNSQEGSNKKDEDGAKRVFFGGERFIEGISGEAYITIQRTELNSPLGLEVQLHITEAICPALSEPGLRALLRFFTGLYVCLNRGDVSPSSQQRSTEAAGRSLVSIIVDHIFLCIKDSEFQLELLMQSLFFSRASVSDGENTNYLTRVMIGGFFLRDTFSRPPCTLVQPSMQDASVDTSPVPDFAKNFCPPIYPLGDQQWQSHSSVPLICLHCLQLVPSPSPPIFASRTVIDCRPLMIHLQEESCLRISSFLADGIVVNPGSVLPDFSINSLEFNLKGLVVTVPLEIGNPEKLSGNRNMPVQNSFSGARLHIEDLMFSQSPSLKLSTLNLEKDPACFCLWKNQPIDASQKKLTAGASLITLSLETCNSLIGRNTSKVESGLWKCVEMKEMCLEVAMVTADGSPLTNMPPAGGVVRVGISCEQYNSSTSVEQLFFVLDLYAYFGKVSERIAVAGKNKALKDSSNESLQGSIMDKVPSDTAITLSLKNLQLRFLESSSDTQGTPLVLFIGDGLSVKVSHRTLGGAMAISSTLRWERVEVDCTDTVNDLRHERGSDSMLPKNINLSGNAADQLRAVFWVQNSKIYQSNRNTTIPFLDISMVHVIPFSAQDIECHSLHMSACVAGIRLGGGMSYAEALLHRFGILGPDGGPGEGLTRGLEHLSGGPLSKLFKASPLTVDGLRDNGCPEDGKESSLLHLGTPDDVDITIELKDWLFALEGAQEMEVRLYSHDSEVPQREERSWHMTFQNIHVIAKSTPKHAAVGNTKTSGKQKYPVELITVGMEGLEILKPMARQQMLSNGMSENSIIQNGFPGRERQAAVRRGGINMAVDIVASEGDIDDLNAEWMVENLKFSVTEPIEAVVKKDELQYLALLCKSEVDSLGRIAAGVLRILKLEGSVGSAAISQLSNLGSESFDKIFTPDKLNRGSSAFSPSSDMAGGSWGSSMESTVVSLEEAVLDSKAKCAALATELTRSESSADCLDTVKELSEKLENMQKLLNQLRIQP